MDQDLLPIKRRFGLVGNAPAFERAIRTALQVASTDMTVLIVGESGTGKETFPKIIHQFSARKHKQYIAVNCGAIPEGTIDSELFGHEKGAFTGAVDARKGYFEVADGGTIFLDEVGELPLQTQVRLLRILETGEFIRVGSSRPQKTNVRVVAATNANFEKAISEGRFREDLFYRLNTVPIKLPPLRERKEDILPLFTRFASDSAEKYGFDPVRLSSDALRAVEAFRWPGNIRQLKNFVDQVSIIERDRTITPDRLANYLPDIHVPTLPLHVGAGQADESHSDREILFKILFEMRREIHELRDMVAMLADGQPAGRAATYETPGVAPRAYPERGLAVVADMPTLPAKPVSPHIIASAQPMQPHGFAQSDISSHKEAVIEDTEEILEESLSLISQEKELIRRALEKHAGKRKLAADELGISERTLYRKIKEYEIR